MRNFEIIKSKLAKDYIKDNSINYKDLKNVINMILAFAKSHNYNLFKYNKLYIEDWTEFAVKGYLASSIIPNRNPDFYTILDKDYVFFRWDINNKVCEIIVHYNHVKLKYPNKNQYRFDV